MALQLEKEVENTGLLLSYQKIEYIITEKSNSFVEIRIGLYPSKEASHAGKEPVSCYHAQIPVEQFVGEGTPYDIGYNVLKSHPAYEGAIDV